MSYGLKVISADGTTVIVDGTSNMFKVAATGTTSITVAAEANDVVDVTLTALGSLSATPAYLAFIAASTATTAPQALGSGWFGMAVDGSWVAVDLNGSANRRAFTTNQFGQMSTFLDGSGVPVVRIRFGNHATAGASLYGRYYVLAETAM